MLETQRLRIRPWRKADHRAFVRLVQDPEMMRYVTHGRTWSDSDVGEFIERQARHLDRHGFCFGALERIADGRVVGLAGMQPHDDGEIELGWWIWKAFWGLGYATEAARALIEYARDGLGLKRLVAVIEPPNTASVRVAEKLGMRRECIKPASETIARRDDTPIGYYTLALENAESAES
ncbi:MAG: GNAT family N-acetyltransferase [Wenzhouxiangella sp.]